MIVVPQEDAGLPEIDTGENSTVDSQDVADEIGLAGVHESDQLDTGLNEVIVVSQEVQVVNESDSAYQVDM